MPQPSDPDPIIVDPFLVAYRGKDADQHVLDGEALGESLAGAARMYTTVATYVVLGYIPRPKARRRPFRCYAKPVSEGSLEQFLFVAPVLSEYLTLPDFHKKAIKFLFEKVIATIKGIWTKPSETKPLIDLLSKNLELQAQHDAELVAHANLLTGGLIKLGDNYAKAHDNMAALHSQLIETLPVLAEAVRSSGRRMVEPVGRSCTSIAQFAKTDAELVITESDAEVIRGGSEMEVDTMKPFQINRISEINLWDPLESTCRHASLSIL